MGDLFSYSAPNNICYKKKGFFFLGAVDFNDVRQQPDTQGRMILPLTDWPEFASWWLLCFRVSVLQKEKKKKKKGAEHIAAELAMMQSITAHVLVSIWQLCDLETSRCCISIHITVL